MASDLNGFVVLQRATRGDWFAFARACLNTLGATLFLGGAALAAAALTSADDEQTLNVASLFFAGNVCYIITGVWWAIATHEEFKSRYFDAAEVVVTTTTASSTLTEELQTSLNTTTTGGGGVVLVNSSGYPRPILVAGPGSVAPPFVSVPPGLRSQDIIQAFRALCWLDIFGAICQVVGAVTFNIGCLCQLNPDLNVWSITMWSIGSGFFTLQGIIGHIMCTSFIGTWLTLVPRTSHYKKWLKSGGSGLTTTTTTGGSGLTTTTTTGGGGGELVYSAQYPECCQPREYYYLASPSSTYIHLTHACVHKCIPAALLNTTGSVLFLIGSLILIYEAVEASNICFAIGSSLFLISNYSDGANIVDELYKRITLEDKIH